jgi:hypothetical protein
MNLKQWETVRGVRNSKKHWTDPSRLGSMVAGFVRHTQTYMPLKDRSMNTESLRNGIGRIARNFIIDNPDVKTLQGRQPLTTQNSQDVRLVLLRACPLSRCCQSQGPASKYYSVQAQQCCAAHARSAGCLISYFFLHGSLHVRAGLTYLTGEAYSTSMTIQVQ